MKIMLLISLASMNISTFIARRYLFSKKSRNIINLVSLISFLGLFISSAALVIILSGFNGIQQYVEQMYGKHAAQIYVYPIKGKTINENHEIFKNIDTQPTVKYYSKVIEETALLKFKDRWATAKIKGIESKIFKAENWNNSIIEGSESLNLRGMPTIILGYGIQNQIQAPVDLNFLNEIKIYSLSRKQKISIQNKNSFISKNLILGGVFSINPDFDQTYALVDYKVACEIFELNSSANLIEIFVDDANKIDNVLDELSSFSDEFRIITHKEKNKLIYAANDAEKWMVLAVLTFILILSSFTVVASITMLIIDKKKDINTLIAIGAKFKQIKNIFFKEGLYISFLGSIIGLISGTIACLIQINFHLIKIENSMIESWPVLIKISDIFMLLCILFSCGLIASYLPSKIFMKKLIKI